MQSFAGSFVARTTIHSSTCQSERSVEKERFTKSVDSHERLPTNFAVATDEQATFARIYLVVRE